MSPETGRNHNEMEAKNLILAIGAAVIGHLSSVFKSDIRSLYIYLFKRGTQEASKYVLCSREQQYKTLISIHNDAYKLLLWLANRLKSLVASVILFFLMLYALRMPSQLAHSDWFHYVQFIIIGMYVGNMSAQVQTIALMLKQLNNFEQTRRAFESTISISRQKLHLPPYK